MPRPARQTDATQAGSAADAATLAAAQRGDRSAVARLLRPETDRVFAVCLRMVGRPELARDLAQEALVKIIRALPSFDGRSQFGTWTTRIAMNTCLTWLRDEGRRAELRREAAQAGDIGPSPADTGEHDPVSRVQLSERYAGVIAALGRLSVEHRTILVLRDIRGLEYDQIADILGLTSGTVKSRLFRARKALRQTIEADEAAEPKPATQTNDRTTI